MVSLSNRLPLAGLLLTGFALFSLPLKADTPAERIDDSVEMLKASLDAPDKGVPQDLIAKAHCVAIVPGVKKAAFIVGAKFGKGYEVCRKTKGRGWGAPAAVRMEGGSFGFQIGASETDVLLLIMDDTGKKSLLEDKFTLGGDASVAGGPVGRSSEALTDAQLKAKILTYSRSRGAFAGLSLSGATLRQDVDENTALYGKPYHNREILNGNVAVPAAAQKLVTMLNRVSRFEQ